jgi:maltose O-acetyltransferase
MSKSEREKMLAGEGYIAADAELGEMNAKAQALLYRFNTSPPSQIGEREAIIERLFGSIGHGSLIKQPFFCDYGCHIFAGEKFFANYDCVILDCNEVRIGNNVLFGPKVQIYTAYHPFEPEIRRTDLEMASPVAIGDDVWIGGGAIICPNVEIGAGTTIGAGSVVTRSIPSNVFAAGNPCRVIRPISQNPF